MTKVLILLDAKQNIIQIYRELASRKRYILKFLGIYEIRYTSIRKVTRYSPIKGY